MFEYCYWGLVGTILYIYIGYPVLLIVLSYLKRYSYSSVSSTIAPSISLLIPATMKKKI